MKKYVANIITSSRIVLSLPLLFLPLSSALFCILCGLTDMIDGAVARKTGALSRFGARLDSFSDFIFMFVCSVKILPLMHLSVGLWVWITLIALAKILNIAFVFFREKKLISIHSAINKITGFSLFLLPFALTLRNASYVVSIICVLATAAAIQEAYFITKEREIL